jgi:hypothetical protein
MLKKSASVHGPWRVKRETRAMGGRIVSGMNKCVTFGVRSSENLELSPVSPVQPISLGYPAGRGLLSQTCGPVDFRRAGIVFQQPAR